MTFVQNPVRAEVLVDLAAIQHNVRLLAGRAAASGAATMAVVKADGYGHGMVQVARAALAAGAEWLGACSQREALDLRAAGITAPIFAWLDTPATDRTPAIVAGIDLSVASPLELDRIVADAHRAGRPARVHLKVDTGLSRNGSPPNEWPDLMARAADAQRSGWIAVVAIWSHLARADEIGHPSIDLQAKRFDLAWHQARDAGLRPLRHLANSAALLTRPDLHFDLVRPGIAVYGLNPVDQPEDLRPAMTFRSSVVSVKRVPAGESAGYGHTWTAGLDSTLALVPVGYADGVPRGLSGRLSVWLAGARRPVVGRVSMDQIIVDCTDRPGTSGGSGAAVAPGDEVLLFGPGDHGEPTAAEWADALGTIHYEIVTNMHRARTDKAYV